MEPVNHHYYLNKNQPWSLLVHTPFYAGFRRHPLCLEQALSISSELGRDRRRGAGKSPHLARRRGGGTTPRAGNAIRIPNVGILTNFQFSAGARDHRANPTNGKGNETTSSVRVCCDNHRVIHSLCSSHCLAKTSRNYKMGLVGRNHHYMLCFRTTTAY